MLGIRLFRVIWIMGTVSVFGIIYRDRRRRVTVVFFGRLTGEEGRGRREKDRREGEVCVGTL